MLFLSHCFVVRTLPFLDAEKKEEAKQTSQLFVAIVCVLESPSG
jgi:hypothetical protein